MTAYSLFMLLFVTSLVPGSLATVFSDAKASLEAECSGYPMSVLLGTTCYFVAEPGHLTWEESMRLCESTGGKLAHIYSEADWYNIYEEVHQMGTTSDVWIGVKGFEQPPDTSAPAQGIPVFENFWMKSTTEPDHAVGRRTISAVGPATITVDAGYIPCGKLSLMLAASEISMAHCDHEMLGHLCMKAMAGQQYSLVMSGARFTGEILEIMEEQTVRHCGFRCMQNGICLSFNYNEATKMCLLFADKPWMMSAIAAAYFVDDVSFAYYQRVD